MPQWSVQGAFASTGRDTSLLVEAPDPDAAADFARQHGILVASVTPSDPNSVGTVRLAYQPHGQPVPRFKLLRFTVLGFKYVGILLIALTLLNLTLTVLNGPPMPATVPAVVARISGLLGSAAAQCLPGMGCLAAAALLDLAHAFAVKHLGPTSA